MSRKTISTTNYVTSRYWQWQSYNIYYVKSGKKRLQYKPLLLVHGFGPSTDHWHKNIGRLFDTFEVWAVELLGFGRSAKPKLYWNFNLWSDKIRDFI